MALVNHAKKEINAKIVYYGPAGSGKNTALNYLYSRIKPSLRGDIKSVPAGADNLVFFDFSPFETPLTNGYRVRLHIYTLTGMVTNPATWKMTLKGADGIIFMANPAPENVAKTKECVAQLRDLLAAYGVALHDTPAVLQLNNFMPEFGAVEATQIAADLDLATLTVCQSNAVRGEGLLEALAALSRQVLDRVRVQEDQSEADNSSALMPTPECADADPTTNIRHDSTVSTGDMPAAENSPQITVLSQGIVSEGGTIQIPLEIMQGGTRRRLVVTVHVAME